jgi:endonuclease YncB( thermonuclease family)
MRPTIAIIVLSTLLLPLPASAAAGSRWGTDTSLDRMLERREERREARARNRYDTPVRTNKIRIGWTIIDKPASPRRRRSIHPALLSGVVDGSIVVVNLPEGANTEVRLLGVDAPEIVRARENVECFGVEARNALRASFVGKSIILERDKRYQKDSFRRLVRYIRSGSQDIGAWMIWNGYAFADRDTQHLRLQKYIQLEAEAQRHEKGLWGFLCDYNDNLDVLDVLE